MALQTSPTPCHHTAPSPSRTRRILDVTAFVAIWMAAGHLLAVGSNGYLLLGIPLTIVFQRGVRHRPLRELYRRNATEAGLDQAGIALSAGLAVFPAWCAVRAADTGNWTTVAWYLAAVAGAIGSAYSLRAASLRNTLRTALAPTAVGSGVFIVAYGLVHIATTTPVPIPAGLGALAKYSALYYPASFVLEEVTFRGAIDAHAHHDGEQRRWWSAVFVSALWGLWHLPVSTGLPLPALLPELLVVHILLGVPLSMAWRRSGNLAGPALAHAVNDAVRNALMIGL